MLPVLCLREDGERFCSFGLMSIEGLSGKVRNHYCPVKVRDAKAGLCEAAQCLTTGGPNPSERNLRKDNKRICVLEEGEHQLINALQIVVRPL